MADCPGGICITRRRIITEQQGVSDPGYVGAHKVRAESIIDLPTIEINYAQEGPYFREHPGCNLAKAKTVSDFYPCRELVFTRYLNEGVSSELTASTSFWTLPRKTQYDLILERRKDSKAVSRLISMIAKQSQFFDNVKTIDEAKTLFLKRKSELTHEKWSSLLLSGILYYNEKLCTSEMKNGISAVCDADLDDIPDAFDPFPFRPHKVPKKKLDKVYNGDQQTKYLCTYEYDPIPNRYPLLSKISFRNKPKPHYHVMTKQFVFPERKELGYRAEDFKRRANPAFAELPAKIGKFPIKMEIEFVDHPDKAWLTTLLTEFRRYDNYKYRLYVKEVFGKWNPEFMPLNTDNALFRHEIGGHILFALDDRYVDDEHANRPMRWDPKRMPGRSHQLHTISLTASKLLRNNLMGDNGSIWPIKDMAASMAMGITEPCSPMSTPEFEEEFGKIAALHTFLNQPKKAVAAIDQYFSFLNRYHKTHDQSLSALHLISFIKSIGTKNWKKFEHPYNEIKKIVSFIYGDPEEHADEYILMLEGKVPIIRRGKFPCEKCKTKYSKFDIGTLASVMILPSINSPVHPPAELPFFAYYALGQKSPVESIEPLFARSTSGSWFTLYDNLRKKSEPVSGKGILEFSRLLRSYIKMSRDLEFIRPFALKTTFSFLKELANISDEEFAKRYIKVSKELCSKWYLIFNDVGDDIRRDLKTILMFKRFAERTLRLHIGDKRYVRVIKSFLRSIRYLAM